MEHEILAPTRHDINTIINNFFAPSPGRLNSLAETYARFESGAYLNL